MLNAVWRPRRPWTTHIGRECKHLHNPARHPILHIPKANVYRFGESNKAVPIFHDLQWIIQEGEGWAVIGSAGTEKTMLLEMLRGHMRIAPPPPSGLYPFLAHADPPRDPLDCVSLVSFASRPRSVGGEFYDFTARYGFVREDDRITLRESLFSGSLSSGLEAGQELEDLAERLDLKHILDLPLVALSNGQTRRARIVKELLRKPDILLLDEPLTGLDVQHRPKLLDLLGEIHASMKPRVIMTLRPQDTVPEWITHVAAVDKSFVKTGLRDGMLEIRQGTSVSFPHATTSIPKSPGKELVSMKNVNVRYHERHVLKNITWTIREGDRWHLQGSNGSGKTTLLSLLTGDHPQSYTQPHLVLFSSPRRKQPTSSLQRLIGSASPELYNAFPRRLGPNALTVRDAIATGFESTFAYRPCTPEMNARIDELLSHLGPTTWGGARDAVGFDERPFATLSPGEQSMVLLLRALVGRPPLLVLDEVFSGMDRGMIESAQKYLRERLEERQAVVFVTHWQEEVPWEMSTIRTLRLDDGNAVEV